MSPVKYSFWGTEPQFFSKQMQVRLLVLGFVAAPWMVVFRETGKTPYAGFGMTIGTVVAIIVDLAILRWRRSFYGGRYRLWSVGSVLSVLAFAVVLPVFYMVATSHGR